MLSSVCFVAFLLAFEGVFGQSSSSSSQAPPSYSPARPPAVPLAVRSPYTSIWTSTSGNGTLNSNGASFWDGTNGGWEGIVTIDGVSYEYLGIGSQTLPALQNLKGAVPQSVSYDSQYSNFTFGAGPVEITASFLSSVLPKDLCRTSIPLSYLTTSVRSLDGAPHSVQLYSDVNGAWSAFESNATLQWNLYDGSNPVNGTNATTSGSNIYSWFVSLQTPYLYAEENDFPLWGNFTYSTSPSQGQNFSFESGYSGDLRYNYVMQRGLNNIVDGNYRPYGTSEPVFAYAHDFGSVSEATVMYTVGSVQQPLIRYLTSAGVLPLNPWWMQCYGDIFQMINFHYSDFPQNQQLAAAYEEQLKVDVDSYYSANVYSNSTPSPPYPYSNGSQGYTTGTDQFGDQYEFDPNNAYGFLDPNNFSGIAIPEVSEAESYYSIIALSTRQVMGAYALTVPPPVNSSDSSQPLMFQKEISSDGNVNTVDVMYPAMPFFLYSNVELLRYNLEPLYQNQEGGFYPNAYSMHDLGTNFPNATGHVEGDDEYMPVEESGNMIIMSYAYYAFSSNSAWLSQRYAQLQKWASYLIEFSLIPGNQLSTDDFAGRLINQTNLAIKGIVGLQAMSKIAAVVGDSAGESNYSATASQYFSQWETLAIDPSGKHTVLGYEWRSSWGLLYNIYPDRLLSLGIIPDQLYNMQSSWYATVSQVFGIPLDNRHHHTKSDWEIWTAATCDASTRRLFVNGLAYWLNGTSSGVPFPDLYETISQGEQPVSPDMVDFQARPVAGGHFALLALGRAVVGSGAGNGTAPSYPLR